MTAGDSSHNSAALGSKHKRQFAAEVIGLHAKLSVASINDVHDRGGATSSSPARQVARSGAMVTSDVVGVSADSDSAETIRADEHQREQTRLSKLLSFCDGLSAPARESPAPPPGRFQRM